jgi:RimJ/RimL family protein N-acetyltransferase
MIRGQRVVLRPATISEMRTIYDWFACSDITSSMVGPPRFPEKEIPTWDQFQSGYESELHYFDNSAPELGRCYMILSDDEPIGQVTYNDIEERCGQRRVELDIWMRSEADCGHGNGADALDTLCRYLSDRWEVREFMVQPSARNPRAIRTYEKLGFQRLGVSLDSARELWGPSDYHDSVYMVKTLPLRCG